MLELALSVIDRLIQFAGEHREANTRRFASFVKPTYDDLAQVHADYLRMFTDALIQLEASDQRPKEMLARLRASRVSLEPMREKLWRTSRAMQADQALNVLHPFVAAVEKYFGVYGPLPDLQRNISVDAVELLTDLRESGAWSDRERAFAIQWFNGANERLRLRWSEVSKEYATLLTKLEKP